MLCSTVNIADGDMMVWCGDGLWSGDYGTMVSTGTQQQQWHRHLSNFFLNASRM